jgi:hypothetical protein
MIFLLGKIFTLIQYSTVFAVEQLPKCDDLAQIQGKIFREKE